VTLTYKRLPVITDYCHGCGLCVEACEHGCLGMIWEFAKLEIPDDCGSEGKCMEVCPQEAIRMEWTATNGDHSVGQWRAEIPDEVRGRKSLWKLLGLR